MRPLKFPQTHFWKIQQLWILLMVTMPRIIALKEAEGDKTYNLKVGFDLTHGSQGASSLRIRNFEESDGSENSRPTLRAGSPTSSSSSNEDQNTGKKKGIPKDAVEMKAAADSVQSDDSDDSDGGGRKQRSTKGLRADEYEPQGPEVREAFDNDSESENSN